MLLTVLLLLLLLLLMIIIIIWQNGRYFCSGRYILNVRLEGASSHACDVFLSDRKRNSGTRSLSHLRYLYVALSSDVVNPWLIICFVF